MMGIYASTLALAFSGIACTTGTSWSTHELTDQSFKISALPNRSPRSATALRQYHPPPS